MPKLITEAQQKLIAELCQETQTTIYEQPKTQWEASRTIDKLMRLKRNPKTNLWRNP
jgi:hypothetical protein